MNRKRIATAIATAAVALGASLSIATPAQAAGGCAESHKAPRSAQAKTCRGNGWTIRRHIVVGPHGWVQYSNLPECRQEDGTGQRSACMWNARTSGNAYGDSLWLDRTDTPYRPDNRGRHYVRGFVKGALQNAN